MGSYSDDRAAIERAINQAENWRIALGVDETFPLGADNSFSAGEIIAFCERSRSAYANVLSYVRRQEEESVETARRLTQEESLEERIPQLLPDQQFKFAHLVVCLVDETVFVSFEPTGKGYRRYC